MIQMTQAQFDELKSKADAYDKLTRDERAPVADGRAIDLFRSALAWGMTYGPVLNQEQWNEMRENMAQQFSEKLSAVIANDPVAGEYTTAMGDAGQAYIDSFPYAHKLPAQFRWADLWTAMSRAAPQGNVRVAGEAQRLDAPAQVGGVRFGKGVSWSTVILAAQRHFQYMQSPAREAERIAHIKQLRATMAGNPAPQANLTADGRTSADTVVNGGALCLALNVLRRGGKNEVADELEKTAKRIADGQDVKHIQTLIGSLEALPRFAPSVYHDYVSHDLKAGVLMVNDGDYLKRDQVLSAVRATISAQQRKGGEE